MTERTSLKGALSVWWRNALIYSKTWKFNLLPNFFEPVFFLWGLGLGLGFYLKEVASLPYPVFLAPGLIAISAMNGASFESTYNVYVRMNMIRTYDAMIATPLNENEIVLGELLWGTTRALLYGSAFYLITFLFGYIPSHWSVGVIGCFLLTGYLFSALGQAYSFSIPTIDLFSVYFTLFLTPSFIFSDTFFPIKERLGAAWAWIPEITPLFHCVRLTRAFTSGDFSWLLLWDLFYILAVGIFFHWLAIQKFKKRIHLPAMVA